MRKTAQQKSWETYRQVTEALDEKRRKAQKRAEAEYARVVDPTRMKYRKVERRAYKRKEKLCAPHEAEYNATIKPSYDVYMAARQVSELTRSRKLRRIALDTNKAKRAAYAKVLK